MQMNEQVLTALEVLRNFAENDFERHRIDVLEKDLTEPPVAEVIDENHQKFNGIIYTSKKKGHYYQGLGIHRVVWLYYHGDIPEGDYEVHHIDENKSNNDVSNLQLLTRAEHQKLHVLSKIKTPLEKICPICGKTFIRKHSTQKYCSKECNFQSKRKYQNKVCPTCGKTFYSPVPRQVYCSQNCVPRKTPLPEKVCPVCGKVFVLKNRMYCRKYCSRDCADKGRSLPIIEKIYPVCNKKFYTKLERQICCSRECANVLHTTTNHNRVCPACGKTFYTRQSKQVCCSRSCSNKLRWQKVKAECNT